MNTVKRSSFGSIQKNVPGNAAPEILADAAGEGRDAGLAAHGEAETETVAGRQQRAVGDDVRSEVI